MRTREVVKYFIRSAKNGEGRGHTPYPQSPRHSSPFVLLFMSLPTIYPNAWNRLTVTFMHFLAIVHFIVNAIILTIPTIAQSCIVTVRVNA